MDDVRFQELRDLVKGSHRTGEATQRLAAEQRGGHTGPLTWQSDVEALDAPEPAGEVSFAEHLQRREDAQNAHQARRRRADAERSSRERLHSTYRDLYGLDAANQMVR
ncbi:hypothetical protein AB0F17_63460 [Nonomuraea sp. NPDC026600]|uniref:hypothetical protein n=1 Tax=Nonomuraea sp. NPDC026600 TaxID=3155363 RepID=UPI0033D9B1D2